MLRARLYKINLKNINGAKIIERVSRPECIGFRKKGELYLHNFFVSFETVTTEQFNNNSIVIIINWNSLRNI
jgi:hypothetical protein